MQKMMLHIYDKVGHCNDFSHTPVDLCHGTVRSGLEQVMETGVAGQGAQADCLCPCSPCAQKGWTQGGAHVRAATEESPSFGSRLLMEGECCMASKSLHQWGEF